MDNSTILENVFNDLKNNLNNFLTQKISMFYDDYKNIPSLTGNSLMLIFEDLQEIENSLNDTQTQIRGKIIVFNCNHSTVRKSLIKTYDEIKTFSLENPHLGNCQYWQISKGEIDTDIDKGFLYISFELLS